MSEPHTRTFLDVAWLTSYILHMQCTCAVGINSIATLAFASCRSLVLLIPITDAIIMRVIFTFLTACAPSQCNCSPLSSCSLNYLLNTSDPPYLCTLPFQEVELFGACYYDLVERVRYLLITGVNVNVTNFVSCLPEVEFEGSQC